MVNYVKLFLGVAYVMLLTIFGGLFYMWGRKQMLVELQEKYKVEEVHGLMLTNDKGEQHFFVYFSDKGDVLPERHWENPETTTIITIHRE